MKSHAAFQAEAPASDEGNGRKQLARPKFARFSMLSLLWVFPSIGAALIVANGLRKQPLAFEIASLARVPLESWIALGVLVLHGVFIFLARRYGRTEQPIEIPNSEPDTDAHLSSPT